MTTATQINISLFNDFLKNNKSKIDSFVKTNPSISFDDEWRKEDCWDEDYKEKTHK